MALGGFSHPVNWTEISNMRNLLGWRVDMDESGALVNKSIVKEFFFNIVVVCWNPSTFCLEFLLEL